MELIYSDWDLGWYWQRYSDWKTSQLFSTEQEAWDAKSDGKLTWE